MDFDDSVQVRGELGSVKKLYIVAVVTAFALKACSGAPTADADAPAAEKLPLEKRILFVREGDVGGKKVTKHVAAFGNWAAECSWSRGGSEERSYCDVYPWNGTLPKRATVITPYPDRATVQYYEDRPAKVVINTAARATNTTLRYVCGATEWSGPEESSRLKFFYDADAQRFISQMKSTDCKIVFTPQSAAQPVEIKRLAHGFREANDYAASFSSYPKPVEQRS
jgi:hypothetical protein